MKWRKKQRWRRPGRAPTVGRPHRPLEWLRGDVVTAATGQAGRLELRDNAPAVERRRVERRTSKQPPQSEEIRDVTEIGGLRWKLGQTK
jgi:hypothetical protein